MAKNPLLPIDLLRKAVAYNPATGALVWLPREASVFANTGIARWWNEKYANRPALDYIDDDGYRIGVICGRPQKAHRVIWALVHGAWPEGEIDHINGVRSDNKLANLRLVSHIENGRNVKLSRNNKSGYPGVTWDKATKSWRVNVCRDGRFKHLGRFPDKAEAIAVSRRARDELGYHANHGRSG